MGVGIGHGLAGGAGSLDFVLAAEGVEAGFQL